MKVKAMIALASMATLVACNNANQQTSGIDLSNLDTTAVVGDDFYQYACGGWMEKNPLPPAYSRYGTFNVLGEENNKRVNDILTELLNGAFEEGSVEKKLSDLYKLAMDSVRRDHDGIAPVMEMLKKMESAKSNDDLFAIQKEMAVTGDHEFFYSGFSADEKNSKDNILSVYQSGLTLGQKEYYLDTDSATTNIREGFKNHLVRMFQFFDFNEQQAQAKMKNILRLETELAKVSRNKTELRDPQRNYNKVTLKDFDKSYPNLKFEELMNAYGIDSKFIQEMVVGQPEFMAGVNRLMTTMTTDEYRDYLEWNLINGAATLLSDTIRKADFDFFGKVLQGRKEDHPLWRRSVNQVENVMGEAIGQIYVKKYFPAEAKERMIKLVSNLQEALAERIQAQDWMSDSTKANAQEKLKAFYVKVGYPDQWTDMSSLEIDPSKSYYENMLACYRFWNAYRIEKKAGKPVDREEWHMYPQTVNAYYNPTTNEICFPAGILQSPFFDMNADDAFNYGAIGVVIGHEMTHGFDDQGRQFDKDGNMHDWWTPQDAENFKQRTDRYADFFSAIKVLPDLNGNGRLTLGENLADHGGLQVSFTAFKKATKDQPQEKENGFTPEQRFFLAYAGVWAANINEEEIRLRTKSDPHSLGMWRVNGALPHIDAWYEAFDIKPENKMYIPKEERLSLW